MTGKFYQNDRNGRKWSVRVIKDTVDIYWFCKIDMKQHKNTCFSSCPGPVSMKQIEKFLHFSFKTVENFSNSKPRSPGQRQVAENPTQ